MPGEATPNSADSGIEPFWWMAPAAAEYILHTQKHGNVEISGVDDVCGIVADMFQQGGLGFVGELSQ